METRKILTILVVALGLIFCQARVSEAAEMGTAFTYQGHLYDANYPANGLYDFAFKLYDDPCTGSLLAGPIEVNDCDVFDAYFTVELDFGCEVFDGNAVWLETTVAHGDGSDPCTLSPRQEITPVPYALQTRGIFVDNAGKVGIGTIDPGTILHVKKNLGDAKLRLDGKVESVEFYDSDVGGRLGYFGPASSGTDDFYLVVEQNKPFRLFTGASERVTVLSNGNVGIGTNDSGGYKLAVVGPDYKLLNLRTTHSNAAVILRADASGVGGLQIESRGGNKSVCFVVDDEYLVKMNDGKVGIGTTSPGALLDLRQSSTTSETSGLRIIGASGVRWLSVWIDANYRSRIDSGSGGQYDLILNSGGGNIGIGTTSPQGALDVVSTTGAFIVPRMTTAQRDALTAVNGMIIYNTTINQFNFYENGLWVIK